MVSAPKKMFKKKSIWRLVAVMVRTGDGVLGDGVLGDGVLGDGVLVYCAMGSAVR